MKLTIKTELEISKENESIIAIIAKHNNIDTGENMLADIAELMVKPNQKNWLKSKVVSAILWKYGQSGKPKADSVEKAIDETCVVTVTFEEDELENI